LEQQKVKQLVFIVTTVLYSGVNLTFVAITLQKCGICGWCMSCRVTDLVHIWWRCHNGRTRIDSHHSSGRNCGCEQVMC